ncbi:MAG: hypothetical protein ACXVMS_00540 [Flavisolibacter sp.]
MKNLTMAVIACSIYLTGFSQSKEKSFNTQAGIQLTSTPVYAISGTDTGFVNSLVWAPYLRLFHQSGWGLTYSPYFTTSGSKAGLYMQTLTGGYEQYEKENVNLEFNYSHFFFSGNGSVPYSPLSNELYGYISFKKPWLAPVLSTSFGFGQDEAGQMQTGLNLAGGVVHSFEIKNAKGSSVGEIDPSLLLNGAANEFYSFLHASKYITHSKKFSSLLSGSGNGNGRGRGSSSGGSTGSGTTTTKQTASFSLENLELNVYSSFTARHFELIPTGSLFLPLVKNNPVSGYWQFKLAYDF